MTRGSQFPDATASGFPQPPRTFVDREDREMRIEAVDDSALDAVASMYVAFDPAERAQGIPPAGERRVYDWLETIFEEGLNVAARHGDDVVGHATLVPDRSKPAPEDHPYELAIFVLQDYQRAGIGRKLLETLLGYGESRDVSRVWLTVERWNSAAVGLYRDVGFETCGSESFELEMGLNLGED